MFLKNMRALVMVLLLVDLAFGAKPSEVSVTLDKADPGGSDNIYIGQTEVVVMTIELPAGSTTDVKIELLPSTTDTIFALGDLINHTVGADLTSVEFPSWFADVNYTAGPEYTDPELGVIYNTRAAFEPGTIQNGGSTNTVEASTITIFYEIVYVDIGTHALDDEYWVSCGMAYNSDNHIWISQFNKILKRFDTGFSGATDFTVSSLTEIEDGGILATVDLTMNIAKAKTAVKVEALVLNDTQDLSPMKIEMVSAAKAYGYSLRTDKFLAKRYEDCSVRDTQQQTLQLDIGYIINKGSQQASPVSADNVIVMRIYWMVTNPAVVGNTYTLGVGVDLDGTEISVATFDVNVVARTMSPAASSHTVTANTTIIPKGGILTAKMTLTTTAESFETYPLEIRTNKQGESSSKVSILSYTFTSKGDNILCQFEDTVDLLKFKTDSANPAVQNEANMTFSLLNTGLMSTSEYELTFTLMAMVDAVKDDTYEVNFIIGATTETLLIDIGDLVTLDENVPYVFTSAIPNGTQISTGAMFDVTVEVVTSRSSLPGEMTTDIAIPEDITYVRFVEAKTLSKGANVLCPPSGTLDSTISSWNGTENDNARGVVTVPMVCNIANVDNVTEDTWTMQFTLQLMDHADILSGSAVNVTFGIGIKFSGNQIFAGGNTLHPIVPTDLTAVHIVTGLTITDTPTPATWPGPYQLQWSPDNTAFHHHNLEWNPLTSLTQSEFKLKKPILSRYVRLTTPLVSGSPAYNFTVTSNAIVDEIQFLGDTSAVAELLPNFMFILDNDNDTCMDLPVKTDTTIPPYLITQIATKLLTDNGIVDNLDLSSTFKIQLLGEGISCNAQSGPQRTLIWNPTAALTSAFHGKLGKCANVEDVPNYHGSKRMCEYECTCDSTVTCGHIILAMIHDGTPGGTYNICDIKLVTP